MGLGVEGLGFGGVCVEDLGIRVCGLRVEGLGMRPHDENCKRRLVCLPRA